MNPNAPIPDFEIRLVAPGDVPLVYAFIRELAEYERLSQQVTATEADIRNALFGERPVAEALLAYYKNEPVGFAVYFTSFSTFVGRPGIYLEDIYIKPDMRGKGFGRALLVYLARLARQRHCGRMEWSVLDWNEPAIKFYKNLGAQAMDEWTVYRLTGKALERLAEDE